MYSLFDLPILVTLSCGLFWLYICLWFFVLVASFFGESFPPAGYLRVNLSPTSFFVLCRCGEVVLELVLPCVEGLKGFLLLLFSHLFLVISSLFSYISRSVLGSVSVSSTPSFTLFCSYMLVLPLLVGCRRYPGVHGFYLLFFMVGCRGKAKWFKRVGV